MIHHKTVIPVCVLLLAMAGAAGIPEDSKGKKQPSDQAKDAIRPKVTDKFGTVITVSGVFVEKGNTYYEQNILREPYKLKILAVNGKDLGTPLTIEYVLVGDERVESGVKYRMQAYETLYTQGIPIGWSRLPSQLNYFIGNQLIIKDLVKIL